MATDPSVETWSGLLDGKVESVECGGYPCNIYYTARILSLVCAGASLCGCLYIITATLYRTMKLNREMSAVQYFPVYLAAADLVLGFGELFTLLPLHTPKLDVQPRWCSAQGTLWQIGVFCSAFTTAVVAISLVQTLKGRQPLPPGPHFLYYILTGFVIPVVLSVIPLIFWDAYGPGRLRCCMTDRYPEFAVVYNFVLPMSLVAVAVGCNIKSALILRKSLALRRKTAGMMARSRSTRLDALALDSSDNGNRGRPPSMVSSIGGNELHQSFSAPLPDLPIESDDSRGGQHDLPIGPSSVSAESQKSEVSASKIGGSRVQSEYSLVSGAVCSAPIGTAVEGIDLVDKQEISKIYTPSRFIAKVVMNLF
eukprot:comp23808_c0_seq3/m.41419 comp23808_c0_seq3/g.41419  ORF comp23808_c0_seq3/g.41419 comp23808_c0_seq3/m.41419 type:complete len:367 (-) comp23808_c0_seq3:45-1145(-)